MKKTTLSLLAAGLLLACNNSQTSTKKDGADSTATASASGSAQIKRGEYLVTVTGCGDCHTPKKMTDRGPVPDPDKLLSGFDASIPLGSFDTALSRGGQWVLMNGQATAAAGPWGISFAANLTPDPTGIGGWSLEHFTTAMRHGKSKGLPAGRELLPPMPWQNFAVMTDEDLESIFLYLKSLKPVNNRVPDPIPPRG